MTMEGSSDKDDRRLMLQIINELREEHRRRASGGKTGMIALTTEEIALLLVVVQRELDTASAPKTSALSPAGLTAAKDAHQRSLAACSEQGCQSDHLEVAIAAYFNAEGADG